MISAPHRLELSDLQAGMLRAFKLPVAAYVFARVDDRATARAWLREVQGDILTEERRRHGKPEWALNLAFSHAGLKAIGAPEVVLASFPEEFREGMAQRAERLGDAGPSSPAYWDEGLGTGDAHVFLSINASSEDLLGQRLDALRSGATGAGLTIVNEQRAAVLSSRRDHFGLSDGISDVAVEGSGIPMQPGQGVPRPRGRWRPVKAGEMVLGHRDEDGVLPPAPPGPLGRNATYLVYRKLFMDVPVFTEHIRRAAKALECDEELIVAKIIGRWRDGTPLVLSQERPDPALVSDPKRANDFRYASDPQGFACPVGSHIRRCYPRDTLGYGGKLAKRHRIIRRGMHYGPALPDPTEDDGQDRGLIFMCFQASISRQFETIQALWINDGNAFGLADDKDFLLGDGDGSDKMTIHGNPPRFIHPQPRFVTVKGGEYLFQPGITGLRALLEGAGSPQRTEGPAG